jgi:hypothetical protein
MKWQGSMSQSGLGPLLWWEEDAADVEAQRADFLAAEAERDAGVQAMEE